MSASGQIAAGMTVPDTKLAREVVELIRDRTSGLICYHSRLVYWWAACKAATSVSASTPGCCTSGRCFTTSACRFKVSSADEARRFLHGHGLPEDSWTE